MVLIVKMWSSGYLYMCYITILPEKTLGIGVRGNKAEVRGGDRVVGMGKLVHHGFEDCFIHLAVLKLT